MKTIYKPVFIKSEADLPKKTGYYFMSTGEKYDRNFDVFHFTKINARQNTLDWLEHVVWYLQPVELPSDEEMEVMVISDFKFYEPNISSEDWIEIWLLGAKAFRDKLILESIPVDQCQKRDELIRVQNELIEVKEQKCRILVSNKNSEVIKMIGLVRLDKELLNKIEQLKSEIK